MTCIECGRDIDPEFDNAIPVGGDAYICVPCDQQEQIDLINARLAERAEAAAK